MPECRILRSAGSRSTPCGQRGTVCTLTLRAARAARRRGSAPSAAKVIVAALPDTTAAVTGVRSEVSATTRDRGRFRHIRTVSCGLSVKTVPTPTITASVAARSACETLADQPGRADLQGGQHAPRVAVVAGIGGKTRENPGAGSR